MKYLVLLLGLLNFVSLTTKAQVGITDDGSSFTPDPSAVLEMKSTSGGVLFPRLTTAEQRLIANPAAGLVVFNTDSSDFYGYDGVVWKALWNYPTDTILRYCPDSIEYSGQWHATAQAGNQCWMVENLNVGIRIDASQAQADNSTVEKYCYNDDASNCDTYGGLYQWNEMMQYTTQEGAQGICPDGWHIPSDEEWKVLEGTVDTQYGVGDPEWNDFGLRGYDAGKRLKSNSGWYNNGNGTDDFGFKALPGGYWNAGAGGYFINLDKAARWWSTTTSGSLYPWWRGLIYYSDNMHRDFNDKNYGYSVRCLMD